MFNDKKFTGAVLLTLFCIWFWSVEYRLKNHLEALNRVNARQKQIIEMQGSTIKDFKEFLNTLNKVGSK